MLRLIKMIILAILAIGLVVIALANRGPMTIRLLPEELARLLGIEWQISLPIFIVIIGAVLAGVVMGFIWEYLRETRHRTTARIERRERERLEQEVRKVAPPSETGDDVLAILDSR